MQLHIAVDVVLGKRVLVPEIIQFLNGSSHAQGFFVVVGPHGVQHKCRLVAYCLAHRTTDLHILLGDAVRMDFVCRPTQGFEAHCFLGIGLGRGQMRRTRICRHAMPAGAEQPMYRQIGRFARQIPQRHIDRSDGAHMHITIVPPHVRPKCTRVEWVATEQGRLQPFHQGPAEHVGALPRRPQKTMTIDACVGMDGDNAQSPLSAKCHLSRSPCRGVPLEYRDAKIGNFHVFPRPGKRDGPARIRPTPKLREDHWSSPMRKRRSCRHSILIEASLISFAHAAACPSSQALYSADEKPCGSTLSCCKRGASSLPFIT